MIGTVSTLSTRFPNFATEPEAGLSVRRRKRKRLVRIGQPSERASAPNQEWALDFASDRLATGRSLRVLSHASHLIVVTQQVMTGVPIGVAKRHPASRLLQLPARV